MRHVSKLIRLSSKSIGIVIVSGVIGLLLMCFAFLLPTDRIYSHVSSSIDTLRQEGEYYSITPGISGSQLDNYTEAIYLNEALVDGKEKGVLHSVLAGYTYQGNEGYRPVENLIEVIEQNNFSKLVSTNKHFWNGYEVVVKLLLTITDYAGIRQINIFVELMLLGRLGYLMIKKELREYVLPVLISFLFINPITIALNMTFSGFFYCTIIPCLIILCKNEWLMVGKRYVFFFEIVGVCAFYFNMNYFQLVTFGIPLIFYFLMNGFQVKIEKMLFQVLAFFSSWFLGYAGMMLFKWVLYAVLFEPNMFWMMYNHIIDRTSASAFGTQITRSGAVIKNVYVAIGNIYWDIIEMGFVVMCINKCINNKVCRIDLSNIAFLATMLILSIGRYIIYANHVMIHSWVTYRILMIPLLAFNVLLVRIGINNKLGDGSQT